MPMGPRSPHEPHRTSTPLELFFDLVFVVAIARAAAGLHHAVAANHVAHGLAGFAMVFFAIWWAWMNFTWFASAYDCDDVPYRVAVFVQITGALVLASGIPAMFEAVHPNGAVVAGYVIMRAALVVQWLRAGAGDPPRRACAYRYASGITVLQIAWLALLLVPAVMLPGFLVLAALEMALPLWAERHSPTTWHPHHIAERYGLLTLIVLGESVLSATVALDSALATGTRIQVLAPAVIGGLLTMFSMWWIYFDRPVHDLLTSFRRAFAWGYGHYLVFASAAAVGTGLAVTVDVATGEAAIGPVGAGLAVTAPVSIYLIAVWILHNRPEYHRTRWLAPAAVPVILLTSLTGEPVLLTGLVLATIVVIKVVSPRVRFRL